MTSFPYSPANPLRLGTRGSKMALIQANMVKEHLASAHPLLAIDGAIEIVIVTTTGDAVRDRRLSTVGGKGMFIKELEIALEDNLIDAAVHSMKDVPSWLEDDYSIAAILERAEPWDVFISNSEGTLHDLPQGAVLGTSSPRREALTLAQRPDLKVVLFRGNADTRLEKLARGEVDATYLSLSGLQRIDRLDPKFKIMDADTMLPAAGQGAIGVEILSSNQALHDALQSINHVPSYRAVMAERACLAKLDGSCHSPLAAYATLNADESEITLTALAARYDGSEIIRHHETAPATQFNELGTRIGQHIKDRLPENFFASPYDQECAS